MNHSESLDELAAALCKAQAAMKGAQKDSQNPAFPRSRFASLASVWDACRGALTDNGLSVLQMPYADSNAVTITTMVLHTSGQWVSSPLTMTAKDASPQSIGSALTYARRYGLAAAVGICPEDDDGEAATDHHAPAAAHAPRPRPLGPADPPRPPRAQPGGNGQGNGQSSTPRTGKALFAWTREQEQAFDVPLLQHLNRWAKGQDFPTRMTEFTPEQVGLAHAEALRKLQSLRSPEEIEASTGREPGIEG